MRAVLAQVELSKRVYGDPERLGVQPSLLPQADVEPILRIDGQLMAAAA
jgi:hypothetical protein